MPQPGLVLFCLGKILFCLGEEAGKVGACGASILHFGETWRVELALLLKLAAVVKAEYESTVATDAADDKNGDQRLGQARRFFPCRP